MIPRTKLQLRVVGLSQSLYPITREQEEYAIKHCNNNFYVHSRKTTYCLECGHSWTNKEPRKYATCPECGKKLIKFTDYKSRTSKSADYFSIVDTISGMQVERLFWVEKRVQKNEPATHFVKEVMQHWFDESEKITTMSLGVCGMSYYYDQWSFYSDMEIREFRTYKANMRRNITPSVVYPVVNVLPLFKRNGIKSNFYGFSPHKLMFKVLHDSKIETLLKRKYSSILNSYHKVDNKIWQYWPTIKIAMRHNYKFKDAVMYFDYLDLLRYFGKDLRNPAYICPVNLKKEHDTYMKRKQRILDAEREEAERIRLEKERQTIEQFKENIKKYAHLLFKDKNISIIPLTTIEQFKAEGEALNHCVYTNSYWKNSKSLIMSARVGNKPVETIEISLSSLDIRQARGYDNKDSKYHARIIKLVKSNMEQIAKIAS